MKRYGIRITLPPHDPLRKSHLLGDDWESYRWYNSEAERDAAFLDMSQRHLFSRIGDLPSQILTKVEQEQSL